MEVFHESGQSPDGLSYYAASESSVDHPTRPDPVSLSISTRGDTPAAANHMPNTQSAKKRLRQSEVRRLRNRGVRSTMRAAVRRVREAVAAGDQEKAQTEFRLACKKLDQAAARNVIHRNAANRTKSRLNAAIKKTAQAA